MKRDAEPQGQARDEDLRWLVRLDEKADILQRATSERHLMVGTYVARVPIPPDGAPVDFSTTSDTGDMHSSSWTGCYLMSLACRLGWALQAGVADEATAALKLGGEALGGLDILSHVSGKPGLLARKIVRGHGPTPRECADANEAPEWHQGDGAFAEFRYRGHPSHHNYHHALRGLAMWHYFLTACDARGSAHTDEVRRQLRQVRDVVCDMADYAYKSNDMILLTVNGRVCCHFVRDIGELPGRPHTRGLMATCGLKFSEWITGDEWYGRKYAQIADELAYSASTDVPPDGWQGNDGRIHQGRAYEPDNDEVEHLIPSLWLAHQIEDDAELKAFYRMAGASLFESKKRNKRSPCNYFYAALCDDDAGADLPGALETLRLYPSATLMYPIMNSTRTDLEIAESTYDPAPMGVLPFNEQAWDNSYSWKGGPFNLDGYLAREIVALVVSNEDAAVWLLADDEGALYRSFDGGVSFAVHPGPSGALVRDVAFVGGTSRVVILATDRGVFRTDGFGYRESWHRVPVGNGERAAHRVEADRDNPHVAWATMADGLYRSRDLGATLIGREWSAAFGAMPGGEDVLYGLRSGPDAVAYAAIRGRLFRARADDADWADLPVDLEDFRHFPTFRQIVVSPHDPDTAFALVDLTIWYRTWPLLLRTTDGGESVTVVGWTHDRPYMPPSGGAGLEWTRLQSLTFDPTDPDTLHGAGEGGAYRSADGGTTWTSASDGLRIPLAHRVFAPRQTPGRVFVTTPAGLHQSTDGGRTWSAPMLVLNGPGVAREERGGLCYLVGYWAGRYFGYVTDEDAMGEPETWRQ